MLLKKLTQILASSVIALTGSLSIATTVSAADKVQLIYSDTVPENDARTQILRDSFGKCLGDGFDFKDYHGATLFKQGTELTAMQRGNLDMASLAIYDFYNQAPESSILGAAYMFRDYAHMRKAWDSGVLNDLRASIEAKTKVKILCQSLYRDT